MLKFFDKNLFILVLISILIVYLRSITISHYNTDFPSNNFAEEMNNFSILRITDEENIQKFRILDKNNNHISYGLLFYYLSNNFPTNLKHLLTKTLREIPFKAFFFECQKFNLNALDRIPFEFVVLPSKELEDIESDYSPFKIHINKKLVSNAKNESVISFYNLNKDAMLIVPLPIHVDNYNYLDYSHFANFIRNAPEYQIIEFWEIISKSVNNMLSQSDSNKFYWLSTSGLGVSWLHIRIDSQPKYYNYKLYK